MQFEKKSLFELWWVTQGVARGVVEVSQGVARCRKRCRTSVTRGVAQVSHGVTALRQPHASCRKMKPP